MTLRNWVGSGNGRAPRTTYSWYLSDLRRWDVSEETIDPEIRERPRFGKKRAAYEHYVVLDMNAGSSRGNIWRIARHRRLIYDPDRGLSNAGYREGTVDESQSRFLPQEQPAVEMLRSEGHSILRLKEVPGRPNPEGVLRFRGRDENTVERFPFEIKTPDRRTCPRTVRNCVWESLKRGGQAPYLLVDARATDLTEAGSIEAVRELVRGFWKKRDLAMHRKLRELRIVGRDFDETYVFFSLDEVIEKVEANPLYPTAVGWQ